MSSSNSSSGKETAAKSVPKITKAISKKKEKTKSLKVSKQSYALGEPNNSLDHLCVVVPDIEKVTEWAQATSYNNAVRNMTRLQCYVCGGPGHFVEVCPMHKELLRRFTPHIIRGPVYTKAVNSIFEQNIKK